LATKSRRIASTRAAPGDVLRQQQVLGIAEIDDLQRQRAPAARRADAHRLGEIGRAQVLDELRRAHHVDDRLVAIALGVETEVLARRLVAPVEAEVRVQHRDAVGQRLRAAARAHHQLRELAPAPDRRAPVPVQGVEHLAPGAVGLGRIAQSRLLRPALELAKFVQLAPEQVAQRRREQREADFELGHLARRVSRGSSPRLCAHSKGRHPRAARSRCRARSR
jgi:hypothetical protein